jgi:hypothetical protein
MPFEFVDNNATIDRASRRRIRSHVAKGKNLGRKLVRPSRIKTFGRKSEGATTLNHNPEFDEEEDEADVGHNLKARQSVVRQIERQVGDGLSDRFSLKRTPESRSLVLRSMFTDPETKMQIPSPCTTDANRRLPSIFFHEWTSARPSAQKYH